MLRAKRVDALIVTSSRVGALYLEHLERIGVPVVLVNNHNKQSGRYTFSVSVDNQHGGYLATRHLVARGHRCIGYISGPAGRSDSAERQAGYRQALDEADIPVHPSLIIPGNGRLDGGEWAFNALVDLAERPTAVFCYNDMTAIGIISAARKVGLAAPDDLAVVGFDNIPMAARFCPPLTTVAQPQHDMGRRAMDMALALITTGDPNALLSNIVIEGELIVRETT